jgi:hypothetical protein
MNSTRIVFHTRDWFTIKRHVPLLQLTQSGSLWMEAWANQKDLSTFRLLGVWYDNA